MVDLNQLHRLVSEASMAHTVEDQVQRVVEGVENAMQVEVCSLYRVDQSDNLRLVANVGFPGAALDPVVLRIGEGLVGTIASQQCVINVAEASSHPAFKPIPNLGEEHFEGFLGVPVLQLRKPIGVLVVQTSAKRKFKDSEAAFLVTVAAQLSGTLMQWAQPATGRSLQRTIKGTSGAPGKSIGRVHLVLDSRLLQLAEVAVDEIDIKQQSARFAVAVNEVRAMLKKARAQLEPNVAGDVLALFDIYIQMLDSDELTKSISNRIQAGKTAFAATRETVDELLSSFEAIEDPYLRARGDDIRHIGDKLTEVLLSQDLEESEVRGDVVLLGNIVSIADIARVNPAALRGVVCMEGSALSHTAVVARALGIPAIMGTGAIDHLTENQQIIVDGDSGNIFLNPNETLVTRYEADIDGERQMQRELDALRDLPAVTRDGHRVHLLANTGLLQDVAAGRRRGAEGIGLFRSELPFMIADQFPTEREQYDIYRNLLESYYPLPVTIRTLDLGYDKQLPYLEIKEDNPALGWRGIRFTLDNQPIFITQLRAMLKANDGLGNMRVLIPMVSHGSDLIEARAGLSRAVEELNSEGINVNMPPVGIMAEVPAVVALLPHIAPLVDFIAIGTNDLTQYLLAVDRSNARVASRYDHLHPAVIRTVADIISIAKELNIPVSICGEMASDPAAVVLLVGLEVEHLSMNSFSLGRIKQLIRGLDLKSAKEALKKTMKMMDPGDIRALLEQVIVQEQPDRSVG